MAIDLQVCFKKLDGRPSRPQAVSEGSDWIRWATWIGVTKKSGGHE